MAIKTIKYENGIEVDVIAVHKKCSIALNEYVSCGYTVRYGATRISCYDRDSVIREVNNLAHRIDLTNLQHKEEVEAIDKRVEEIRKCINLKEKECEEEVRETKDEDNKN